MELSLDNLTIEIPWWVVLILGSITAYLITHVSIPPIIKVSHKKKLYEHTNGRGSHNGQVPTLGGIGVFAAMLITMVIFSNQDFSKEYQYTVGAMVILFFAGVKDDLLVIDPKKKLVAQVLAAGLVVVLGDVRITSFHGLANIGELPYLISIAFSIFVYIVIINGFNLIDGIDGLASGVAILVSLTFGVWFIIAKQYSYALMPFALAFSLISFFRYNVFSVKNKIFLGDTGSLIIGLVVAVIAVNFLEFDHPVGNKYSIMSAPAVAFGVLIVPLFDTLRVFTIRVFGGESPFKADRKHIHHRLLDLGCSHIKATLLILGTNLIIIVVVVLLRNIGNLRLLSVVVALATAVSYIPIYKLYKRNLKVVKDKEIEKERKLVAMKKQVEAQMSHAG